MQTKEKNMLNPSLIERLFDVGAHFGYSRTRRHPSASPFLFGTKGGTDIIDLEKTCSHLHKALELVKAYATKRKVILFVGTKPESRAAVLETAEALSMPSVTHKWIGGTLTNFSEIKKRVERMKTLKTQKEKGELAVYSKKERRDMEDEMWRLARDFSGIANLAALPDALFVIDPRHEDTAVREAKRIGIPFFALANSDCNLKEINYPILANDGSQGSIAFFLGEIKNAYTEGLVLAENETAERRDAAAKVAEELKKKEEQLTTGDI